MAYVDGFLPNKGGGGALRFHKLALPVADFSVQDLVHFRASDDTAWRILSQTVAAVPPVDAVLTHAQLSGVRSGYNLLNPFNRDPVITTTTTGYIYFDVTTGRFRKLDTGGLRETADTTAVGISATTVINGKTYFGHFATNLGAIVANADAADAFFYDTGQNVVKYWDTVSSSFRTIGSDSGGTFQEFFGTNRRWLGPNHGEDGSSGVVSTSGLAAYFVANPGESGITYYYFNVDTSSLISVTYEPVNVWEDTTIDWILDNANAVFLGRNGLAGTEELNLSDEVRDYFDEGNYDSTKTYVYHNEDNATSPTGGVARFTSTQSSSFVGEYNSAGRPTADSRDIHDWGFNTSTNQLEYVQAPAGIKTWVIVLHNSQLGDFFPGISYSWAGEGSSGPYDIDFEYSTTELFRAIAEGEIEYDSTSPIVYFDTTHNQIRYITSYTVPNYGRVHSVSDFTPSVAGVDAYERPTWDEVLEGGSGTAQTEAELRTLLSFTLAEQSATLIDLVVSGNTLTATQEDGSTIPLTLPAGITDVSFDDSSKVLTVTPSSGTPFTVDLTSLVDEFEDEPAVKYIPPGGLSGVNALTGVLDGVTAYEDGLGVAFVAETSNSGAMTLRINTLGFVSIRDINGGILPQNAISIGKLVIAFYQASSNTWRSNIYVAQDISGKADTDLQNLDTLNASEQSNVKSAIDAAGTDIVSTSAAGLMSPALLNILNVLDAEDPVDTASEIRALLGFTIAEQQETIVGAPTLSGNVLTFTHEDGGTTQLTLPTQAGTTDGVVTGVAFNETTRVLTLTRSGGLDPLTEDLSALQAEHLGEQIHFVSDPADIAGTNALSFTIPDVTAYEDGLGLAFIAESANSGNTSMRINSLTTYTAHRSDNTPFTGGEITVGKLVIAFYDGTINRWITNVNPPFSLPDGSVTRAKIANSAVDGDKIDSASIIAAHIVPDAITPSKIENNALENRHYSNASITQDKFASSVNFGGTTYTTGAAFPSDPSIGDIHTFDVAATGLTNTVNNAADAFVTTADIGDTFKYTTVGSNDRWVLEISGGVPDDSLTTEKYRDGSVTAAKLAAGIGTDLQVLPMGRSESITLQSSGAISSTVNSAEFSAAATSPIAVEFGEGAANILSVVGGESIITVLRAGVYDIDWVGTMDVSVARAIPRLEVYASGDTIGTDEPLTRVDATYFRATGTGEHFTASGHLIIRADNTTIKLSVSRIPSLTGASTPIYTINAGSKVFFSRGAAGGMTEEQVEEFVSQHIQHVIRRRLRVGGGVLERGDARFDATTIEINVHDDTEDDWFGDLPVGAEIRVHGLTSGARSRYTLVSVTQTNDDATLTVTRDSHTGIFSNEETVVLIFDQEHSPQSDWTEEDENRPAYIKHKPDNTGTTTVGGIIFVDEDDVTSSGDGITLTIPSITEYADAIVVAFRYPVANTAAVAIRINALDYRIATRRDDAVFIGDEITQNQFIFAVYDDDDNTWRTNVDINPASKLNRTLSNVIDPVSDTNAKNFRERAGIPKVTTGASFPGSPNINDIHTFDVAATGLTSALASDLTSAVTTAAPGDLFKFTVAGTNNRWVLEYSIVSGLSESQVEDFITEHIRHTIRRRNIVGAGTLQVGDVRFDATTINLNVHTDLEDGWLGDLPVGAEIRIHGLTSGARSSYTLDSVTESGDDATLTVTRDSHSGIFTNQETVVITFDQEHDPQADWTEEDENRPAYIKDKPGRTFYWMHDQTERIGTIVTGDQLGEGNRRARFDDTKREESHGGIGNILSFVTGANVSSDADKVRLDDPDQDGDQTEVFEDNQFFTINGKVDLKFQAHTRADQDLTFVARLVKIRFGTDDLLLQDATSTAVAADIIPTDTDTPSNSAVGNTVNLEYDSLESDGTEQFSIQLLGFQSNIQSGIQGFIQLEEI